MVGGVTLRLLFSLRWCTDSGQEENVGEGQQPDQKVRKRVRSVFQRVRETDAKEGFVSCRSG